MDSLDNKCNELKRAYDSCFNTWFSEKFLKGNSKDPNPCETILKLYSDCVKNAMERRNMDPAVYAQHWIDVAKAEEETAKAKIKNDQNARAG